MSKRWKPKAGERYWVAWINEPECVATFYDCHKNDYFMEGFWNVGNCFKTKEAAEAAAGKLKVLLLSLHKDQPVTDCSRLPDWCKPGKWVFDKAINKYSQVTTEDITEYLQEVCKRISKGEIVPARLRPYNDEEMKSLVGKILVNKETKDINLVTDYINEVDEDDPSYHYCTVYVGGENMVAGDLLEDFTIDGYPCGQLERKEDCDDNF